MTGRRDRTSARSSTSSATARRYRRGCAVWHRRAGKDSCALNLTARDMFRRVGTYWHLFPEQAQARRAIWNGIDRAGPPDHRPDAAAGGARPHQRARRC